MLSAPGNRTIKAVLHVRSANPYKLNMALDNAEALMQRYKNQNKQLVLEILVNAEGLALVRADSSLFRTRIRQMQSRYTTLSFLACNKTIKRLRRETGINPKLLPGVVIVPSALDQITNRLEKGWGYIKI